MTSRPSLPQPKPVVKRKKVATAPPSGGTSAPPSSPQVAPAPQAQIAPPSVTARTKAVRTVPPPSNYGGANAQPQFAPPQNQGGANMGGQTQPRRNQRILPADPQVPMGGQQSLAPRQMTPTEGANFYNDGGGNAQYQGLEPKPMEYTRGSVAPYRMIVRRGDGKAVVIEQGQTIDGATLRQAPEAGDWAAYYDGKPPDSSYTTNKIREQELARIQSQQYEQQFGLPQGDTSTWRGWLSQYIGGAAEQSAVRGAIGMGTVGLLTAGPVGLGLGIVGGLATGYALGSWSDPEGVISKQAAALGLAKAKSDFDATVWGLFGKPLNFLSESIEQVLGVGSQTIADPQGTWSELGAAWEAGRLYYESDPTAGLRADSRTFVDTDMPDVTGGAAAMVAARREIAANPERKDEILAIYTGQYGVFGQLRDLVAQSALDPSNLVLGYLTNRGIAAGARAAGATTLLEAAESVKPKGVMGVLFGGGGVTDVASAWKNLKVLEPFREGFTGVRDLTWYQKAIIGTDLLQVYDGTYTKPKWFELSRLTPDSMAHDRIVQTNNLLQSFITGQIPLDENFPVLADAIVQQMRGANPEGGSDAVTRVLNSLEGSVIRRVYAEGGDVSGDLLKVWRDTANDRAVLGDMLERLKLKPGAIIEAAAQDIDALLKQYTEAGGKLPDGTNPKVLGETLKMMGEGKVPMNLEEYRAGLMSSLTEQAGQWAARTFQVKAPSLLERFANLNKSAQSVILLGPNPTYAINNVTNNEFTMVSRGILAWRSVDDVVSKLDAFGLSPARLGEGLVTADALKGDIVAEFREGNVRWGEESLQAGQRVLDEATATPGRLDDVQRKVSGVGKVMPFLKLSQKAEAIYSARAMGNAWLEHWGRNWRAGRGFAEMPGSLAATLSNIDPRLPSAIHAAIEAGTNPRDIMERVFSRLDEVKVSAFYEGAARQAGLTVDQLRDVMAIGGLEDTLNTRLAEIKNPTPADVRRVFNDVRIEAEAHLAELTANQAKVEYEAAAVFAGDNAQGFVDGGAVAMLLDQGRTRIVDTYIAHSRLRASVWDEYLTGVIDSAEFRNRLKSAGDTLYKNGLFPQLQAHVDGVASAFAKGGRALPEEFTTLQRGIALITEDFHAQKQAYLDEFFGLRKEQKTAAAWAETQRLIDELYNNMTGHVAQRQELLDEYLAVAYEAHFPGSGNAVREWRDMLRAHDAQYQEAVRIQFDEARQLQTSGERNASWREFDSRMTRYRQEWLTSERELRRAAMELVPGREALEAEARRLRGVTVKDPRPAPKVEVPKPDIQPAMEKVTRDQLLNKPRFFLPDAISRAIESEAIQMYNEAGGGMPGFRQFIPSDVGGPDQVIGIASTYPDWYGALGKKRQTILNAIQKIIEDGGKDIDRSGANIIRRLKAIIMDRLAATDELSGRPPEPEILRWRGASEAEIQAAINAWDASGEKPFIPVVPRGPELTEAQLDILSRNISILEARENLAGATNTERTYRVSMVDPMGVAEVVDEATGKTYEVNIDQVDAEPMLPPGMLAQGGGMPMPIGTAQAEMYHTHVRPALEALQGEVMGGVERGRLSLADNVPPEIQDQVRSYLRTSGDKMAEAKLQTTRWAEFKRDAALLNYSRRYMADTYLSMVAPYQFWASHSVMAWAMDALQRPALLASFYRIKKFLNTAVTRRGTPARLGGRIKFDLPFMPDWMGGAWVNPLNLGLPIDRFGDPWEQVAQSQSRLGDRTQDTLEQMLLDGEITREDYRAALAYNPGLGDVITGAVVQATGAGMPTAYAEAQRRVLADDPSLRFDVADLVVNAFPPSLLVYNAYQTLRGTPERIGPLPITRDIRNLSTMLGIGGPGGVNLEGAVRQALNMPVFDQWGDYRTDRELANMAVEGLITTEQARAAMIERSGPAYEMAQTREAQQGGGNLPLNIFGRLFGGATVFPEGEATGRQIQLLYKAAQQAQDNGDTEALSEFFQRFPEIEARLALSSSPDKRLREFLKDQIYSAYDGLPTLYRRQAVQQFGQEWQDAIGANAWDEVSVDTLAAWARRLGRYVPDNVDGGVADLSLAPEPVAYQVQQFYDERNGLYDMQAIGSLTDGYYALGKYDRVGMGNAPETVTQFYTERDRLYPGIGELLGVYGSLPKNTIMADREAAFPGISAKLDAYFAMPKGTGERKAYIAANPDISAYFDWSDQYKASHPEKDARKNFRAQHPELEQYFGWSDAYKAEHPEAAQYMESDAPRVRDVYMDQHPELGQYWDWRGAWMDQHPESAAWIKETAPATSTDNPEGDTQAPAMAGEVVGSDALKTVVKAYLFSDERGQLPYSARQAILPAFEQYGRDGQTLEQYLLEVWRYGGVLEEAK